MDAEHFDNLARSLTGNPSRRRVLRTIASATLGQVMLLGVAIHGAEAGKTKFKTNKYGCVNVGEKCFGRDGKCCSGICNGKGKRSKCVAHHEDTCAVSDNSCRGSVPCGTDGQCYRTTGKAGFCGEAGTCDCHPCKKDKDCEAEYGEGAACIVCITGGDDCVGVNGSKGTACVPPAPGVAP